MSQKITKGENNIQFYPRPLRGRLATWLCNLITDCLRDYHLERPMGMMFADRNPTEFDYQYSIGAKWKNYKTQEVRVLMGIRARWEIVQEPPKEKDEMERCKEKSTK